MRVAVDISLYPIADEFIPPIDDVIERLNTYASLEVSTNAMSTQVRGEYDLVMDALTREIGASFESLPRGVFVIKILNNPLPE
jgi:uncharacterized protein YqgV (UPF0045/DUF77 family)